MVFLNDICLVLYCFLKAYIFSNIDVFYIRKSPYQVRNMTVVKLLIGGFVLLILSFDNDLFDVKKIIILVIKIFFRAFKSTNTQ